MIDISGDGIEQGEFYRSLLSEYDNSFPQLQGLEQGDEFESALMDPRVITTTLLDGDGLAHKIPQLSPIDAYSWLNLEHYTTLYPEQMEQGNAFHYMDVPGVIPGEEVKSAINRLALRQGVLIFDYPSIDDGSPERVVRLIEESGGGVSDIEQLGTQTYYAGRVRKKNGFDEGRPIMDLQSALTEMQQKGLIPAEIPEDGASYTELVDADKAEHLYSIYDKAFQTINDHPCRQGFTPDEFHEAIVDTTGRNIGKLILNAGGEVANMVMFSHDLPFPWLSKGAYKNLVSGDFPIDKEISDTFNEGDILYFPAIATNPDNRRGLDSQPVIDLLAKAVDYSNNEVVTCFDCCDFNKDILGLPAYIARLINNTEHARVDRFAEIGQQRYMGVRLQSKH